MDKTVNKREPGALMKKEWDQARLPSFHVYAIENLVTHKVYVGSTTTAGRRFKIHDYQLRAGIHHVKELQADWCMYGGSNFVYKVLQALKRSDSIRLINIENTWIDALEALNPDKGYNKRHAR